MRCDSERFHTLVNFQQGIQICNMFQKMIIYEVYVILSKIMPCGFSWTELIPYIPYIFYRVNLSYLWIYFGKYAIEQVQVSRAQSGSSLYRYDLKGLPMGPHTDVIWHHPPEVSNHNEHWNTLSSNKKERAENRQEIEQFS